MQAKRMVRLFGPRASLIIRTRLDRRMHYSVAFRCRLCIAFVDVQGTAFVRKPVRLVWKSRVSLFVPGNSRRRMDLYGGCIGCIWGPRCNSFAVTWPFHCGITMKLSRKLVLFLSKYYLHKNDTFLYNT